MRASGPPSPFHGIVVLVGVCARPYCVIIGTEAGHPHAELSDAAVLRAARRPPAAEFLTFRRLRYLRQL
eukprot:11157743-Lingulodinium_polyedra.AAC.1